MIAVADPRWLLSRETHTLRARMMPLFTVHTTYCPYDFDTVMKPVARRGMMAVIGTALSARLPPPAMSAFASYQQLHLMYPY